MSAQDCGTCGVAGQWQCVTCPRKVVAAGPAVMYVAPLPRCPAHGQMSPRPALVGGGDAGWVCHGWDGEGCPYTVAASSVEWRPIGHADAVAWSPLGGGG